ncbi:GATOR complex protein NPRL2-like isoform X2 [Oppia nitens]|uniref:GATOR complex protein NPRL2-like isoform X2 n=1 Tax=Oppia nitens TaxID=1686743 RepID=UPI0023DA95FC|nr:GATOR complex protein NPRL2-like isoform X2 [Oppia nitens]
MINMKTNSNINTNSSISDLNESLENIQRIASNNWFHVRHGHQRESLIKCIFFCQFHHTFGPKIIYQIPEDYVSKESFDSLNVYLIPKNELQGKLITVNALGLKIIGFPIGINDSKYPRNRLIFNVCFVCNASLRTTQYEPIVRKLANYLIHLELESSFLSDESEKSKLPVILSQIKDQLNSNRVCSLSVSKSTTINLKVARVQPDPLEVQDYHVPVLLFPIIPNQWDLTTQQILPYIDGFRHISRIAMEADVEMSLVKACVQNMIYYGLITLIPIFQYSNVYITTPLLVSLAEDVHLQDECIRYVSKAESQPLPTFRLIFQLYCHMSPGMTVKDLCIRFNPSMNGIDEKMLIKFGLMKGFIRRIQKYPIFLAPKPHSVENQRGLYRFFDGNHSYDEICCKELKSYNDLEERVEKHPAIVVCWK